MAAEKDAKSVRKKQQGGNDKPAEETESGEVSGREDLSDPEIAEGKEVMTVKKEAKREQKRATPPRKPIQKDPKQRKPPQQREFPIIAIGASAGGLEALEILFSNMPPETGMSFVVVTHTDPSRQSMLPQILQRGTKMEVIQIKGGMTVKPNTVYLPPSNKDVALEHDTFEFKEQRGASTMRLPIDTFFKSLAENRGERAGCIVLSGTGTDGSQGLRFLKENGGLAMAQRPESAKYSGMPESAIATGLADFVLDPAEMPRQLIEYFSHPSSIKIERETEEGADLPAVISKVVTILANRTGHDFSQYKKSTLIRRIQRRMSVTRAPDGNQYIKHLHRHPDEIDSLFQDLLIGVTSFFRDPEAFSHLKEKVLPELLTRNDDQSFRVWVAGCATGEEVYSIVILLMEVLDELDIRKELQIFGTDIDETAIEKARDGLFPPNIAADVSPARLKRFFEREDSHYRVRIQVREPVVFATQNVLKDPPFSRLDLLLCRNLLIYLESSAQKKLIPLFHYALKSGGVLFLGTSETVGDFTDIFAPISKKWNIYRKRDVSVIAQPQVRFPTGRKDMDEAIEQMRPFKTAHAVKESGIAYATERLLLKKHTPTCVIVNHNGEIHYIHGRTGKYLEPSAGYASLNVVDMAREGLRFELSYALRKVKERGKMVRREGLKVKTNGELQEINLTVKPMAEPEFLKDMLMILFEEAAPRKEPARTGKEAPIDGVKERVIELERELARVRQDHRTTLEELETSNEELKSLNEELQSSNEELQSTNEELESSREELQSLNEELATVNSELHDKITEVSDAYETITDVLNSTRIAILFVDEDSVVKRFTSEAAKLINLIENDVGRPLSHISTNLKHEHLREDIRSVIHDLSVVEKEVATQDGHWYSMRIVPYRTKDNRIDGAIVTFINIDEQKKAQQRLQ